MAYTTAPTAAAVTLTLRVTEPRPGRARAHATLVERTPQW